MKRIFTVFLILTVCLSAVNLCVFAERGVTVELVDFLNYINAEDVNNVIIKTTNNTDKPMNIMLVLEIKNQDGENVLAKEIPVNLNKKSVIHTATEIDISETGEYSLCLSAYNGETLMVSYTEYLLIKNKVTSYEDIGVCTHFDFNSFYETSDMKVLKDSGFSIIRDECRWQTVEKTKGKYKIPSYVTKYIEEAKKNNVEVLLMLAFNNTLYTENECDIPKTEDNIKAWLEYVRFVVRELKDSVKYYEVWNEPNHENFNRNNATAAEFAYFLSRTYEVIKDECPEAYVVSGGIAGSSYASDYVKELVASDVLDSLDAFGVHPYCRDKTVVDERTQTSYSSDIDYLINDCGVTKPIWIAEVGYSTHENEYTEEEKGAYNVRTMLEFIADGRVEKLLLYQLKHVERGEGYGMIDSDGTAYDSFKIVHCFGERIGNADFIKKWSTDYCSIFHFRDRATKEDIFITWTKRGRSGKLKISGTSSSPSASISGGLITSVDAKLDVSVLNTGGTIYHYDAYGNKKAISVGETLNLDFMPTYIVCEKPYKEDLLNIETKNGKINCTGFINDAPQFITARAVEKNSKKTVYLNQIEVSESGEFNFAFVAPDKGIYEIYVYNGETNYEKLNIGSVETQLSVELKEEELKNLSQLNEKDIIQALVNIDSKDESLEKVYFVAAVYNYEDQLLYTKTESIEIDTSEPKSMPVEIEANNIKDWKSLKFFIWNAESIKPIADTLELEK